MKTIARIPIETGHHLLLLCEVAKLLRYEARAARPGATLT